MPADLKTRYSIFVPKPLARINLGDWQRRDGSSSAPKFGYSGVSIQTEQNLFVEVGKSTYLQMRGSFVAHAVDWLQCSSKPMVLATADNATIGVDGTATMVAGAGQAPTWTMDHGDALETVPYIPLQLHYRVEEVQNSLFEFFRGRREKSDPFRKMKFDGGFMRGWKEAFLGKKEVVFNSAASPIWNPWKEKGAKEGVWDEDWKEPIKELRGGFESIAERSWQELYGKSDWNFKETKDDPDPKNAGKKLLKKFAPHDIFGGLKDIRSDPDTVGKLQADIDGNTGKGSQGQLTYGFSAYFSRFDPYLLLDPATVDADTKLNVVEKGIVKILYVLNNVATIMKRHVDVLYKAATLLRDNALMKVVKDALLAVDAVYQPIKSLRGNAELVAAMALRTRGSLDEQIADESLSGLGKRGYAFAKPWAADVTTKAAVRSMAAYKDPSKKALTTEEENDKVANQGNDPNKGFYGGQQYAGGGYILVGGSQLKEGDQIHVEIRAKDGIIQHFDTPPLVLGGTSLPATAATIAGRPVPSSTWTFAIASPPAVTVTFDKAATSTTVDLGSMPGVQPTITGTAPTAAIYGANSVLIGTTLAISAQGTELPTLTFAAVHVGDENTLRNKIATSFPSLDVTVSAGAFVLKSLQGGPGASIVVASCTAAVPLGLAPVSARGPSIGEVQAYFTTAVGSKATLTNKAIILKSSTSGAGSWVVLDETSESGAIAALGLGMTSNQGKAAKKVPKAPQDVTAEDLVALFSTVFTNRPELKEAVAFTAEDGQVVITSQFAGPKSSVVITGVGPNDDNMKTALQFIGDFRSQSHEDHVQELVGVDSHATGVFVRGLDDFDKANAEIQKMPDDVAVVFRPITVAAKNAIGTVTKAIGMAKAITKVVGLKLPTAKGSIGLIANKGISLGTPDRIVGAGGQGIVFIADGGAGSPDHAKYATLEDLFNKIMGADFFARWEPPKDKASLGFRVFSDTTVDLTARNTAHLLALGRTKNGEASQGCGVARVAGSYAVELAGHEKVVIGARQKDLGRVEVLGSTIAIGYTKVDIDDQPFGLVKRGPTAGWPSETGENKLPLTKEHAQTNSVLVHSTEQACILVGEYMVQVRSKKSQEGAVKSTAIAKARVKAAEDRVESLTEELQKAQDWIRSADLTKDEDELNQVYANIDRITQDLSAANTELKNAKAADAVAANVDDEGVIISMRDAADDNNKAASGWAFKGKPAIVLNKKGVTVTTMTGKADDQACATIVLDSNGISISVGGKSGFKIKGDSCEVTDGTNKAKLSPNGFAVSATMVTFDDAQKISLG